MKPILKATAMLGSASAVNILTGLVSAKVSALLLGPSGMGYMGLMQSLLSLAGLVAGMGVGTGLVRAGARALAENDERQMTALRRSAWVLYAIFGGSAALLMILARTPLSRWMLGGPEHTDAVVIVAIGLMLTMATATQNSVLNAYHRVGVLARSSALSSVLGVTFSVFIIWRWRAGGIPWALLAVCVTTWAVSAYYMHRSLPRSQVRPAPRSVLGEACSLLKFGAPFTASLVVGAGVVMAMPVVVLHALHPAAVGYYRAAATLSVTYLGFLTASMGQDYYPRVSAAGNRAVELRHLVNEQHRLVMLIAGPIIIGMLALVPYLVPLIYSRQFTPSVALLEWQLLGDIFKFSGWTMGFVVLARSGSLTFFCLELVCGIVLLLFSWLGARWLGLEGLGIGFLANAALYYLLCWIILRRNIGLRWTRQNLLMFSTLLLMAAVIRVLPYIGLRPARTPIALAFAALASAYSVRVLTGELGGASRLVGALRGRYRARDAEDERTTQES